MTDGTKCKCPRGKGLNLCKRHHNHEMARARRIDLREVITIAGDMVWERGIEGFDEIIAFMNRRFTEIGATLAEVRRTSGFIFNEIEFYTELHPQNRGTPPKTELEAISRDKQNVHAPAVNKQTACAVATLTETPIPVGQDTLVEIKGAWETRPVDLRKSILKDMTRWYKTALCREEDDYLYRRVLDGLWTRIKMSPQKEDLVQRLWEETEESRKTCCDGHISRLCNVLVGYDETFKAPVSVGEILQSKIAAIAGEDIDVLDKVVKAWEVMEELQIPDEQRKDWIEAF